MAVQAELDSANAVTERERQLRDAATKAATEAAPRARLRQAAGGDRGADGQICRLGYSNVWGTAMARLTLLILVVALAGCQTTQERLSGVKATKVVAKIKIEP
ncbi:hypothetical protein [Rhizobium halophytocola]|uniref:Uncharacterized protein n=1 Tax=Rhizobium halophytocola TaxID=735519 RepID=A0ABS4E2E0_9HYPH|nr:hypothetical protein [Rhizobium halophytocola]MBP1852098.1 hypothetical protein [Rhizobium halophytocola]